MKLFQVVMNSHGRGAQTPPGSFTGTFVSTPQSSIVSNGEFRLHSVAKTELEFSYLDQSLCMLRPTFSSAGPNRVGSGSCIIVVFKVRAGPIQYLPIHHKRAGAL